MLASLFLLSESSEKIFHPVKIFQSIFGNNESLDISLTNGTIYGLSNLRRSGDMIIQFRQRFGGIFPDYPTRLEGRLQFDELVTYFNYKVSVLFASDEGRMKVGVKNVIAAVTFDIVYSIMDQRYTLDEPTIKFENLGSVYTKNFIPTRTDKKGINSFMRYLGMSLASCFTIQL